MDWLFGSLFGVSVLLPLFVMACKADEPDEEDSKTLMGALD